MVCKVHGEEAQEVQQAMETEIKYSGCFRPAARRKKSGSRSKSRSRSRSKKSSKKRRAPRPIYDEGGGYLKRRKAMLRYDDKKKSKPLYRSADAECGSHLGSGAPQGYTDTSIARLLDAMGLTRGTKALVHWVGFGDGREAFLTAALLPHCCIDAIEINQACVKVANAKLDLLRRKNKAAYRSLKGRLRFTRGDALEVESTLARVIFTTAVAGIDLYDHLVDLALASDSVKILGMFAHDCDKTGLSKPFLDEIGARYEQVPITLTGSGQQKSMRILFLTKTIKKRILSAETMTTNE